VASGASFRIMEMPTIFIVLAMRAESIEFPVDTQCGIESPI